jgi:hypothetical protein
MDSCRGLEPLTHCGFIDLLSCFEPFVRLQCASEVGLSVEVISNIATVD